MQGLKIEEDVSLATLTTFTFVGWRGFFVRVGIVGKLRESLDFARDQNIAVLVLRKIRQDLCKNPREPSV